MDQGLFANLAAFVAISPSLGLLSERLQLKRVVPVAVDRAICEVQGFTFTFRCPLVD
jgi:CCR4-NOT transcription complex subunit 1